MTDAITTLQQLLEEESLDRSGERVVCRWCRADAATDHSLSHDSDCEWWDFAQEVLALARAVAQAAREEERDLCLADCSAVEHESEATGGKEYIGADACFQRIRTRSEVKP